MNEDVQAAIDAAVAGHSTINLEIYYWWCTALMIAIHAGFLAYEMGASRRKNALASGVKNILAFAFMIPTFFAFGWFIYLSGYNWPFGENGIDLLGAWDMEGGAGGIPWAHAMGPNLQEPARPGYRCLLGGIYFVCLYHRFYLLRCRNRTYQAQRIYYHRRVARFCSLDSGRCMGLASNRLDGIELGSNRLDGIELGLS